MVVVKCILALRYKMGVSFIVCFGKTTLGNVGAAYPLHSSVEKYRKKPFHGKSDSFEHGRRIARVGAHMPPCYA